MSQDIELFIDLAELIMKKDKWGGICVHLDAKHINRRNELFTSWKHFSGRLQFPVPRVVGRCPSEAYQLYDGEEKWDKSHKYGRLRHDLLFHMFWRQGLAVRLMKDWSFNIHVTTLMSLLRIYVKGPRRSFYGICGNTSDICAGLQSPAASFRQAYESWEHFSGNHTYPVPSTVKTYTETNMYELSGDRTLWRKDTKYGQLRWDLLEHLIRHFIQQVKDYG